jgi:hypothetical protein
MIRAVYVHENGVRIAGILGERALLFADVEVFSYALTRYSGGAVGLQSVLTLWGQTGRSIRIKAASLGGARHSLLEEVRDHLTGVVVPKLLRMLYQGQVFWWSGGVKLAPDGIADSSGKKTLRFAEGASLQFVEGHCWVYGPGDNRPRFILECSSPNFYPGLIVVKQLFAQAGAAVNLRGE